MRKQKGLRANWSWKPPYARPERLPARPKIWKKGKKKRLKIHPFYDSERWQELRYKILARDNGVCQLCGASVKTGAVMQVDHIKPRSKYPDLEWDENNLQTLCKPCNIGKKNRDSIDWRITERTL